MNKTEFSEEESNLSNKFSSTQETENTEQWDAVIESRHSLLDLHL